VTGGASRSPSTRFRGWSFRSSWNAFTGAKLENGIWDHRRSNGKTPVQDSSAAPESNPAAANPCTRRKRPCERRLGKDLSNGDGIWSRTADIATIRVVYGSAGLSAPYPQVRNLIICLRDGTTPARPVRPNGGGPDRSEFTLDPATGNTFRPFDNDGADGYTPRRPQTYPPDTRLQCGPFRRHYSFSKRAVPYVERPSPTLTPLCSTRFRHHATGWTDVFGINFNNPLLVAGIGDTLCPPNGLGAGLIRPRLQRARSASRTARR